MAKAKPPRGGAADTDGSVAVADRTVELGTSGLKGARPMEGWLYEEFLPQLRGIHGAKVYRQMADNDPIIGAAMFAFKMLLRAVPWSMVAAAESPDAETAKEWAESVFFKDMQVPFGDVLSDILSFLQYGFAPAEVVYKVRRGKQKRAKQTSQFEDRTVGIAKIAVRAQDTIWRWHFDEDQELLELEQMVLGRPNARIPVEKLLLFRTENTLGNPEGRSLLRNCYVPFLRKNTIEEAEGRAAIRAAGLVLMAIPSKYLDPNASGDEKTVANAYKAIADKVAQDKMGSVLMPSDVDPNTKTPMFSLSFVTTDATRPVDMTSIIERYDKRMLSTMMADWILLGQQSTGSFALSDNKTAMFAKACGAFLSLIEDQFNRVLMGRLWDINAFDPAVMPRLKPGDLEAVDLDKLGMFILRLAQAGAELFPSPELQAEIMDLAGLKAPVTQG